MKATGKTLRAALYARISQDRSGEALGVARQFEDTRALAEARGWEVVAEFSDDDLSAYTGKRKRPGYDALMAAVADRRIDRIVVYTSARLLRNRVERAAAFEALREAKVVVAAVQGPDLDFQTAQGRWIADMLGGMDTVESELISERVIRQTQQLADRGRPATDLGYGWTRVTKAGKDGKDTHGYVLDKAEAKIVREIVRRLTKGDTIDAVARSLNERGIPGPGAGHKRKVMSPRNPEGRLWMRNGLRAVALRPSNAGLRVHHGEVVGKGTWPPIIDEAAHRAVVAVLTDPRRKSHGGESVRSHLLTFGIGYCGTCGARLKSQPKRGVRYYRCETPTGCVARREDWVDALVDERVVGWLRDPRLAERLTPAPVAGVDPKALTRLADLRTRLDKAADAYAEGSIDVEQMTRITARLRPQIEAAERATRPPNRPTMPKAAAALVGANDAAALWARLPVLDKRAVLRALGVTVTIMPTRPGPGFREEDVVIEVGQFPE